MGKSLKMNNKGSTLIIVLVVVAFVAILGTVSITAAMLNFKMKEIDRDAKKTFYTAEEAVDQLYAGLGRTSMECMENCYNKEMQEITRLNTDQVTIQGEARSYRNKNEDYNRELRINYMKELLGRLFPAYTWNGTNDTILDSKVGKQLETGGAGATEPQTKEEEETKDSICAILNSYLQETDRSRIRVDAVGQMSVTEEENMNHLKNYEITLKDCTINYQNKEGYLANVTVDCKLGLPDITIDFVDNADNNLTTFAAFSMIGCSGVMVGDSHTLNVNDTKLYAGGGSSNGGLEVGNSSVLNAQSSTLVSSSTIRVGTAAEGTVATRSAFNLSKDSRLWCTDLELGDNSSNCTMNINGSAFVKDDLTVNGTNNSAVLSGNYIGWSYEGKDTLSTGHTNSSAMIVNGKGSKLDLTNVTSLILGGRSYIDMDHADSYMTGESVSLRADQEIYLVPDRFLKNADSDQTDSYYRNPIADTYGKNVTVTIPDNYFAKKWLDTNEYTTTTVDGLTYYYLNLKKEYTDDFIHAILGYKPEDNDQDMAACQNLLKTNLLQLQQELWITSDSDASIYTNGALIRAKITNGTEAELSDAKDSTADQNFSQDQTVVEGLASNIAGKDSFQITAMDLGYRYMLASRVLYEPSFYHDGAVLSGDSGVTKHNRSIFSQYPITINVNGSEVDITKTTENVFTNFVNVDWLKKSTKDGKKVYSSSGVGNTFSTCLTSKTADGTLYVDGTDQPGHVNIADGLIVTDGDVVVKQDFNGTILAGGTITIDNSVTVTNHYSNLTEMLSKLSDTDKKEVQKFFTAWNSSTEVVDDKTGEPLSIEGMTYKDIVTFDHWRKSGAENETE